MTEQDLTDIEKKLGVSLPGEYRDLMLKRSAELKKAYGRDTLNIDWQLELRAKDLIDTNLIERDNSDITDGWPEWWKTLVIIGEDGGGNYCCLRLDGKPGVFVIGTDWGDQEEKVYDSLAEFVEDTLREAE